MKKMKIKRSTLRNYFVVTFIFLLLFVSSFLTMLGITSWITLPMFIGGFYLAVYFCDTITNEQFQNKGNNEKGLQENK